MSPGPLQPNWGGWLADWMAGWVWGWVEGYREYKYKRGRKVIENMLHRRERKTGK